MVATDFVHSTCRADVDDIDHLADRASNKKHLQKLLQTSKLASRSDDGTIWHQTAVDNGIFYFVSRRAPETICLYMPYSEIILAPGLLALEVCSWQSTILGGYGRAWQIARDEVIGMLLRRSPIVVSSDRITRSGSQYWEDLVGKTILSGGRGGSVSEGLLSYQEQWSWFAPEHLGRNGSSRFFIERTRSDTQRQTVGKEA